MENSKTYKLYKSGKLWVIGAVAVAGVAVSANTTQVNADKVSNTDAQAVKTTDTVQDDKQAQLTASSTDQTKTDDTAKADNVSLTAEKSTVPTTDTSTAQSIQATSTVLPQVKAVALTASVDPVASATSSSDDFGDNDDSNLPGGDTGPSSSSDNGSSNSSSDNSGTDTPTPTPGDDNDNGSTLPDDNGGPSSGNGGSSSSSDNGSSSSSTDNGGSSSDNGGSSSSSDNGGSNSSSDQGGSSSNNGGTDNSNAGGSSSSNDNNTVPLTPTTPDKNDNGATNHVKPVEVTPDSSGNVVSVPTQVASVPGVARAVESYNQALTANAKDANNDKVVDAKQKLDDAVAKALPETHATQAKSSIGILSAVSGVLAMTGALIFKRFKN
ncbi:serine-rich aggregation substance UasX [Leuconostoc falkenbergense]|uniref:serine-rich aggregation substance UasX n=1 Tax=Leuconostoc falkenbergense TaxID=2766470 RepID=UPI00293C7008|nr:serine-rich aggregation substance UasX [Leuconostoc falkenbergense]MDV3545975.1 serine-rich aggregation substance UasX [Leuconostoc falkenbergense]